MTKHLSGLKPWSLSQASETEIQIPSRFSWGSVFLSCQVIQLWTVELEMQNADHYEC